MKRGKDTKVIVDKNEIPIFAWLKSTSSQENKRFGEAFCRKKGEGKTKDFVEDILMTPIL